ncbi:MAG: hypothetical protein JEZ02_11345 [Desulfatibacillum sp.]|nr:hypothetical protein [Desulfatibacillum sp.]
MKAKQLGRLALFGITALWLSILILPAGAEMNVQVGINLPPLIQFSAPPEMVVLPETYVYVVPDVQEDIFFYDGWWWRPWKGNWYRSQSHDRDWAHFSGVPVFYNEVPKEWRQHYKNHDWKGRRWQYERIPHQQVQQNWHGWKKDKHWKKNKNWGVEESNFQQQEHGQQPQVQEQGNQGKGHGGKGKGHGK